MSAPTPRDPRTPAAGPMAMPSGLANLGRLFETVSEDFARTREEMARTQEKLKAVAVTVISPKRQLKVTVGPQGELRQAEFMTSEYRRMTKAEISALVVETVNKARAEATETVRKLIQPGLPDGFDFDDLAAGKIDIDKLLPADLLPPDLIADFQRRTAAVETERTRRTQIPRTRRSMSAERTDEE
ncbi:YbaB/EbfC family nucleoid-associated protein [Streptomyces sp. NPDC054841]